MDLREDVGAPTPVDLALDSLSTSLDHLVKMVEDGGLDAADDVGLVRFLQGFERVRNRLPLVDHRAISDAERRGLPHTLCQANMRRVLTTALRLSPGEAARRVRAVGAVGPRSSMLGEQLEPVRPHLAAAQRTGEVSPEQVAIIERALHRVDHRGFDPADLDTGEHLLTGYARQFGPRELSQLADTVVDAIDPDGTRPRDALNADRRFFHLRPTRDGAWAGEFRLTGELGAKLSALLNPLARPRISSQDGICSQDAQATPAEGEPSGTACAPDPGAQLDPRHHGQRLHDALEDLCDRLLRAGGVPDSGGTPATVIVTIDAEDLQQRTGCGTTSDGTLIPTDTVRRLTNSAEIYPAVINATGCVLNLGRTRRIATPAQTAALIVRDRGCSFPGCTAAPEWCERHHILEWVNGGRTDLNNLTLLCRYHHHNFLSRGWTCQINPDGLPEWTAPRWADPGQKPMLNSRIVGQLRAREHRRGRPPTPART